ncbi:uncharacterized mitochondrial protein AtMg00310-like [Fagus crenata]
MKGQVFRSQRDSTPPVANTPTGKSDAAKTGPREETNLGGDHEHHDLVPNSSPFDPLIAQKNIQDSFISEADSTSESYAENHAPNPGPISPAQPASFMEDLTRLPLTSFNGPGYTLKDITNVMVGPNSSISLGKGWKRLDRPRQGISESPTTIPTKKRAGQEENQAKYFPSGNILDDNVKSNGSYAWRSIIQSRYVLKSGSRWRIRNGSSVLIWGDNWLPGSSPGKVISPRNYFPADAKVSSLIDMPRRAWKERVINHVFMPLEASLILGIPLSRQATQDKIIWPHTPSGIFTV